MYKFTVNQWYKYHSIIDIVKEERIQKEKKKKKYDIISFLNQCMRGDGWVSEVALKFSSYTYTFRVSGLLTTENDDIIYLLLLKTITTITYTLTLFFIRKRSIK